MSAILKTRITTLDDAERVFHDAARAQAARADFAPDDRRLSLRACLRQLEATGHSTVERFAEVRALMAREPELFQDTRRLVDWAVKEITQRRWWCPPRDKRRILADTFPVERRDGAETELSRRGFSLFDGLGAAYVAAGELAPDAFGPLDDPGEPDRRQAELDADVDRAMTRVRQIAGELLPGLARKYGQNPDADDPAARIVEHIAKQPEIRAARRHATVLPSLGGGA